MGFWRAPFLQADRRQDPCSTCTCTPVHQSRPRVVRRQRTFVWKYIVGRICSAVSEVDVQPISGLIHLQVHDRTGCSATICASPRCAGPGCTGIMKGEAKCLHRQRTASLLL